MEVQFLLEVPLHQGKMLREVKIFLNNSMNLDFLKLSALKE